MRYNILYRGSLSSCNYACEYCPFAKHTESRAELEKDRLALARFTDWVAEQPSLRLGVFFTPWGEALVRRWYQRALVRLTHIEHVERAVIQTNLSCNLDWIETCNLNRLALWATFHPTEVALRAFVDKVRGLIDAGVRLSVGVVGLREHIDAIHELRAELPSSVYLWINAYKRMDGYYSATELDQLRAIDAHFPTNNQRHESYQKKCAAGEMSFTVNGDGVMHRCHFVNGPIGNIYTANWREALVARLCPNKTCSCHIGYVNLQSLQQDQVYGANVLERIPLHWESRS